VLQTHACGPCLPLRDQAGIYCVVYHAGLLLVIITCAGLHTSAHGCSSRAPPPGAAFVRHSRC
jgi:hypothetical protein